MDKIGFYIRCGIVYWIITIDSKKPLLLSDPVKREFLTECKSISGRGVEIPPMLILSGALTLEKWVQSNNLDREIVLITSLSSYSNDKLNFK